MPVFACQSLGNSYYKRFVLHAFGTASVIALLIVLMACTSAMKQLAARVQIKSAMVWNALLYFLFLVYPSISATVIRVLRCRVIDGKSYLLVDFSLRCDIEEYQTYRNLAIFFICLYPIGILMFFVGILAWNKRNLPPDWWPEHADIEARKAFDVHRTLPGNKDAVYSSWYKATWAPKMVLYEQVNGRLGFLFNACESKPHCSKTAVLSKMLTNSSPVSRRHTAVLVVRGRADDL